MSVTGATGSFMALRVGIHPNNLHLFLAERWAGAFAGLDATCIAYGEGRDSARLLVDGIIDVCGTGSTPPILAQTEGLDVLYVAAPRHRARRMAASSPRRKIRSIASSN
jgi:sulfonate transport system substrate-binding protein